MNAIPLAHSRLQHLLDSMPVGEPTAIIAGHYCLAEHMNELSYGCSAEIMSFRAGISLAKRALDYGKPAHLVLWINDVGIDPKNRLELKSDYALPDNYSEALTRAGMSVHDLTVMFESTARNKASVVLRKIYKRSPHLFEKVDADEDGLVRCINSASCEYRSPGARFAYVIDGPDESRLVVKEGSNPKCNLILATFFESLRNRFSPGFQINIFNQVYINRLALGIHVSRRVFENATPMVNVLCDGDTMSIDWLTEAPHEQEAPPFVMTTANGRSG